MTWVITFCGVLIGIVLGAIYTQKMWKEEE